MLDLCTVWIPVDRTMVILSSVLMVIGAVHYDRALFLPYLFWVAADVAVNVVLCAVMAGALGQVVYVAWLVVCFEMYALSVVYSEFGAIPRKLGGLRAYLEAAEGWDAGGGGPAATAAGGNLHRSVPNTFDGSEAVAAVNLMGGADITDTGANKL